ncbi:helix-turn-helix domain-containing protein [Nocardia huaxiensis]|uniref:helix-turn-helix domain-containing protein n=1 Tax=Nocardia huaxiensis TaxID=2755382 RepID=UPI001C677AD2|nr:helix-turn-helix domain-containing protein [Nocardia huaxiensis]
MTAAISPPRAVTAEQLEQSTTPPESLRPWITEIGHIPTVTDLTAPFTHVPAAVTTVVLRTEQSGRRDALVLGPRTRATYAQTDAPARCTRLRLAPGATQSLLGLPAADLTDRVLRLAEVPGPAAGLAAELAELEAFEAIRFLEEILPQRLSENPTAREHRRLLDSAVTAMATGTAPVSALATGLAVSERQLRNLFTAGVGVSPKHYARITRIRQVLASAGNTPWSDIAASTGYYDQSHMTADFRSLMGVTPDRFFQGRLPAPTACRTVTSESRHRRVRRSRS